MITIPCVAVIGDIAGGGLGCGRAAHNTKSFSEKLQQVSKLYYPNLLQNC